MVDQVSSKFIYSEEINMLLHSLPSLSKSFLLSFN